MQLPEFDLEKFEREVDILCQRELSLVEAIVIWCANEDVELDLIGQIINKRHPALKLRMEEQARRTNNLRKTKNNDEIKVKREVKPISIKTSFGSIEIG